MICVFSAAIRSVQPENRQEVLQFVETPDDLVEASLDGGQTRGHGGVALTWKTAVRSWGAVHDGMFSLMVTWVAS